MSSKHPLNYSIKFIQDMKICNPEGRDCIENKATSTFNCSVACEGIYADVQWAKNIEEDMEEDDEGNFGKAYNILKKEIEMIKGSISKNGDELDRQKYMKLISEYRQFKKNEVQHFRFNSAAQARTYGKFKNSNTF